MARCTLKKATKMVDDWNSKHPIGTEVTYEEVIGVTGKTKDRTTTEAWITNVIPPYAQAVIMLEGKRGWVSLEHVKRCK